MEYINKTKENLKTCNKCNISLIITSFKKKKNGVFNKCCIQCLVSAKKSRDKIKLKNKDKFKCKQCDSKFSLNGNLNNHVQRVHSKIKNKKCNFCNSKFSFNSDLKRHIKQVHDKVKDFECNLCDSKFSLNGDLNKHVQRVHNKIKNKKCNFCDFKCYAVGGLNRHVLSVHDNIKSFKCKTCNYKCSLKGSLMVHIKRCNSKINCSSGEFKIMEILKKLNIGFEYNTTYKVKHKSYLRWDFIIEINNKKAFIEYDGRQHFKPVPFGGMSEEEALIAHDKCVVRDGLKNEFCKDNNLKLLRIPYFNKENIETLIKNFIK